ncbi:MAG: neuraminidase-like domain-containing protein [Streptosporangiaceae bacterium]
MPVFEQQTGVSVSELTQILLTRFINPGYPSGPDQAFFASIPISYSALSTLAAAGFSATAATDPAVLAALETAGISLDELAAWWSRNPQIGTLLVIYSPDDGCDIANATIAHLGDLSPPTDTDYDNLQAFIRLWRTLGWTASDLDRAITASGAGGIDATVIHALAAIGRLEAALSPPSLPALLALWTDLDTRGDDSLYAQLFLNPAVLPNDPAFDPGSDGTVLPGSEVISAHLPALLAALGISAADLTQICADAGLDCRYSGPGSGQPAGAPPPADAQLSPGNVSVLYRYALAARVLGLDVSDFIALKGLAGATLNPVSTPAATATPDSTAQFVTLAAAVAQSEFTVTDLAYLYRHDSVPPTGLAPQQTALAVLAQALQAGLARIAAATTIAADPQGALTHSALVQLVSKAVADQTVAAVNGTARYTAPVDRLPAALARYDGTGRVTGVDPAKTPVPVGAKLGYDPAAATLSYQGAMTSRECADLLAVTGDASYVAAVVALFEQAATFLADSLAPLLDDPAADTTLWRATPSLDGKLHPVYLNKKGKITTQPDKAVTTAIAAKFGYLLTRLLPYLRKTLSHALVKQAIADTFALDPAVASLLLESSLTSPTTPGEPVIADLLGLAASGVTASLYPTSDLSGSAAVTGTVTAVSLGQPTLGGAPQAVGSARFSSWLSVPASATFTFRVATNGTPALWIGSSAAPVPIAADAPGTFTGTVALTAGQLVPVRLEITGFPASPAVAAAELNWQAPTIASTPIPAGAQLPATTFAAFTLAYIRIQKAALLTSRFALTAPEVSYLQAAGHESLFAGFDLNALPLAPGAAPGQVAALFAAWPRLNAYVALRNGLPAGSVTLIDVFTAATLADASALLPQATGWDPGVVSDLLGHFLTASAAGPNPVVDETLPTALRSCVQIISQVGASAGQLFSWATFSWPDQDSSYAGLHAIADDIKNLTASRYDPVTWLAVAGPLSDILRASRRDALVAYLTGVLGDTDPDHLFELLLIDPEMGPCMQTSRIRQAINSVQLFVQRCLLDLEQAVTPSQIDRATWEEWKGQYSLWAANRMMFMFPENWLLPQLRDDQTPLFQAFSAALQQGDVTTDLAQAALLDYLKGLDQIARLDIRAVYPEDGEPYVLHVFARTFHQPYQYFYRRWIDSNSVDTWTPWEPVTGDIEGDHLIPAVWLGRLRLIWPVFTQQTLPPPAASDTTVTTSSGTSTAAAGPPAQNYWKINLSWSEYYQGKWQPKQVSNDFLLSHVFQFFPFPASFFVAAEQPSQSEHVFTTVSYADELVVELYAPVTDPNTRQLVSEPAPLLGAFSFSASSGAVNVAYSQLAYYDFWGTEIWPTGIDQSSNQAANNSLLPAAELIPQPGTSTYFNSLRQVADGGTPFQLWAAGGAATFLSDTPTRFQLVYPEQNELLLPGTPFFYQDGQRTFFVKGGYYIIGQLADPAAIDLVALMAASSGSAPRVRPSAPLLFQTHRHSYVGQFIESLVRQQGTAGTGVAGLLNIANQNPPSTFSFYDTYGPVSVATPLPDETVDFSPGGAYQHHNWETFLHGPALVALTLSQNQRYEDADTWYRYIFDPNSTDPTVQPPARYWQVQPFRTSAPDSLLQLMEGIDNNDPAAIAQLTAWEESPFQPFAIARVHLAAFQKYVFMRYLDNLIAWGDQLFGQADTIESINQATQLYILAANLLGPLPERIAPPATPALCYAQLGALDPFANIMETLENAFPYATAASAGAQADTSGLLGLSKTLLFGIPANQALLQYWDTVADRLYKIRHCLNIQGVPQQLSLFQGPANVLLAIEAAAQGTDPGSILSDVSAPLPSYRFSYLIVKAAELASECQAFGRAFLDALEKNDAESLALLRATQEANVLTLMHDLKQHQVDEANAAVDALNVSRTVAVSRYNYYQLLLGTSSPATPAVGAAIAPVDIPLPTSQSSGGVQLISQEQSELNYSEQAAYLHLGAGALQAVAGALFPIPQVTVNVNATPLGVGTSVGASEGGSSLGRAAEALAKGAEVAAAYLTYQAWAAGKMGGYFRRQQDWALQANLAAGEIMRIDRDIAAASLRVTIAQDDLAVHDQQTANAQQIEDFLTGKFTSQQLYGWMVGQASGLYSQLYQLAYGTAKLAEVGYQRELGVQESSYITFGYWDSLRKGLLAGDRLKLAVRQLERAYLDGNQREYEITRHVSLLLHDPAALIALKTTGQCVVDLPEELFDLDYPGHYLRRLRDVSLTIPCVAGPYTSINCTLTLLTSKIRADLTASGASASPGGSTPNLPPYPEGPVSQDPRFIYNFAATQSIATSHAQNDSGLFEVSFRDERYLPFETAGVISRWLISMPPACNAFDFDSITDVVLRLSYTARDGGDLLRSQAFSAATLPALVQQPPPPALAAAPRQADRGRLFSLRHEFPTDWYGLLHPASATAPYGQMPIWLTGDRFPFQYRGAAISTGDIEIFALLSPGASLASGTVELSSQAPPAPGTTPVPPTPVPGTDQVSLSSASAFGTSVLYGRKPASTPANVPQVWWLSVAQSELSAFIDQVKDFFVLIHYSVA